MLKTFAVGALLASICAAAVAPGATETAEDAAVQSAVKGDGARASEPACSQTGWPHYANNCIRGRVQPSEQLSPARQVRIVTVDRLPR
jgi:hypothetical protein